MEFKLFATGLFILIYFGLTKVFDKKGFLEKKYFACAWHGVFCAICFFIVMFVVITNLEDRKTAVSVYHINKNHIILLLLSALAGFLWGFLGKVRKTKEQSKIYLKNDSDWSKVLFGAFFIAAFVMHTFVQAFKIPSASMLPAFERGDHLFVNKIIYGVKIPFVKLKTPRLRNIERGDNIIFRFPDKNPAEVHCGGVQHGKDFIKRVIGLPNETIEIRQGKVFIDGSSLEEPYVRYTDIKRIEFPSSADAADTRYQKIWESNKLGFKYGELLRDNFGPVKIPENSYFVLGDNRDHSCDGRFWGPVPEIDIKGKAWFIYWPIRRAGGMM